MARGRPRTPKEKTCVFFDAPEVRLMAQEIVEANHPHLQGKNVRYVFCAKTPTGAKGCKAVAAALLMGGLPLAMALGLPEKQTTDVREDKIHVIRVVKPVWSNLNEEQKRARLDHALSHCWFNDKGTAALLGHDVEEFRAVVIRHGLLSDELKRFGDACVEASGQQKLPLEEGARPNGSAGKPNLRVESGAPAAAAAS